MGQIVPIKPCFVGRGGGAAEMAQQLRALDGLAEDPHVE